MEVEFSSKGLSNFLHMGKNISNSFRNEIYKILIVFSKPYFLQVMRDSLIISILDLYIVG